MRRRARYEQALPLYRQVGAVLGEANCIKSLGRIELASGNSDAAALRLRRALELYRSISEPYSIGWALLYLARLEPDSVERANLLAEAAEGLDTHRPLGSH
jgi:tetratricopeptide (TPR) repeat protein